MTIADINSRKCNPKICMPTRRHICREVFNSSIYEAEDVLADTNDVDLIFLEPDLGLQLRKTWVNRLAIRDVSQSFVLANPGVRRIRLTRDYDLFVAVCQTYEDLLYINCIDDWKNHCKTSVCWIDEVWANTIRKYRHWMSAFRKFDHVFVSLEGSVGPLSKAIGRPCHFVPSAVDTLRFTSNLSLPQRVIDVFSMGRRYEGVHQALRSAASRNEFFYLHDTFAASKAAAFDHREHREHFARLAQRSRYFIVAPAKMDANAETQGQIEVGFRYWEGAAAGAVMIGQAPDCAAFREMFDWEDSVIEIQPDGSDVLDILRSLDAQPQRLRQIRQRNAAEALLRHDWVHRWQHIFQVAGIEPSTRMLHRNLRLQELAEGTVAEAI